MRAVRLVWCRVRPADGRALSYQRLGTVHGVLGVAGARRRLHYLPTTYPLKLYRREPRAGPLLAPKKIMREKNGVSPLGQNGNGYGKLAG